MSGEVISLVDKRHEREAAKMAEALAVPKPSGIEPSKLVWTCWCESQMFSLREGGYVMCEYGHISGTKQWFDTEESPS